MAYLLSFVDYLHQSYRDITRTALLRCDVCDLVSNYINLKGKTVSEAKRSSKVFLFNFPNSFLSFRVSKEPLMARSVRLMITRP